MTPKEWKEILEDMNFCCKCTANTIINRLEKDKQIALKEQKQNIFDDIERLWFQVGKDFGMMLRNLKKKYKLKENKELK